jgi:hypothetical protein
MSEHEHVDLVLEGAPPGKMQPVEVERLDSGHYRVLYTPGLVEGIAAGDTIRITDRTLGHFEVVSRGGNIAVKLASDQPIGALAALVSAELEPLGGRFDGALRHAAVWTVPVSAGFEKIESVMSRATAATPASNWWYGNVYDGEGEPLRWWAPSPAHPRG